jgi:glycosyltransferase 2 family protein
VARWSLRVLVSVGIVVYILVDVDRHDLIRAITGVDLVLVPAALALYLLGQLLSGYKWSLIGCAVGFDRSASEYARFYLIGSFFNLFGLSTIGGDVIRALYLADGRRTGLAINSVLFDRVSGLALLTILGAAAPIRRSA